jgi:hypothetical protein
VEANPFVPIACKYVKFLMNKSAWEVRTIEKQNKWVKYQFSDITVVQFTSIQEIVLHGKHMKLFRKILALWGIFGA